MSKDKISWDAAWLGESSWMRDISWREMKEKWKREEIKRSKTKSFVEWILPKLREGYLFGEKVDEDDSNALIMAAYYLGRANGIAEEANGNRERNER